MTGAQDFSPQDVRLMQNLAQRVSALRPELVNSDATVGELAWVWGKDHLDHGDTWRRRLWFDGSDLAGWGWIYLPYQVMRSDGQLLDVTTTRLIWQVHPYRPQILDEILDWYPTQASPADLRVTVADADADAQHRLAAHGYRLDEQASGDHGSWTQFNRRDLGELPEPMLPPGFRLLTADQVSPEAAAQAHRDAWHPSSFTDRAMREVSRIWPYRPDLHVLVQAPDGTMAATTIMWLDEHNGTAEFEPVGTHQATAARAWPGPCSTTACSRPGRPARSRRSWPAWAPRRIKRPGRCTTTSGSARSPARCCTSSPPPRLSYARGCPSIP
jgi:hypothetical protein